MEGKNMIQLGDDGTMDTVLVCSDCGAEMRYNFDGDYDSVDLDGLSGVTSEAAAYDRFVAWAMADAREEHVCGDES